MTLHRYLSLKTPCSILTEGELKRLRRFKLLLRTLIDKKVPLKQKKKHLIQRGGNLLSYLLPPALNTLATLLAE